MSFIFEGDFDLGAIELDPAVVDKHVLRHDFRHTQFLQMFSGLLDLTGSFGIGFILCGLPSLLVGLQLLRQGSGSRDRPG